MDLDDLLRLVKRLLRNGRNFEKMLDQLESRDGPAGDRQPARQTGLRQGGRRVGQAGSAKATSPLPAVA